MNHFLLSGLLNASIWFSLGIFVYSRDKKNPINRTFTLFALSVATYSFGFSQQAIASTQDGSLFWIRFLLMGTIFIPIFFLQFTYAVLEERLNRNILLTLYLIGILFEIANFFTPWLAKDPIPKYTFQYLFQAGVLYPALFLFFAAIVCHCLFKFYSGCRNSTGLRKNQLKYLLGAPAFGFSGGTVGFVLGYNWISIYPAVPIATYAVSTYGYLIAYAIVKYRLMDINLVLRDTTVHLIASLIVAVPILVMIISFPDRALTIAAFIILALVNPVLYAPLKKILKPVVEKSMFGDRYDYLAKLGRISDKWFTIFNFHNFLNTMITDIAQAMRLKFCNFLMYDEDGGYYKVMAHTGDDNGKSAHGLQLKASDPLVAYLNKERVIIIKEELLSSPSTAYQDIINGMEQLNADISIPIVIDNHLRGLLNLGAKANGEMYNKDDLDILNWLVEKGGIMFRYTLYNFKQAQLFSRYSHDLGNPLAVSRTYIKLMLDGDLGVFTDEEERKTISTLWQNINFVDECIRDMKYTSQIEYDQIAETVNVSEVDINRMIKNVANSVEYMATQKKLYLTYDLEEGLPVVYADKNRLERLIRNLLGNGIKFTEKGGVSIRISRQGDEIKIMIIDTGPGIPPKDLPSVFDPFFRSQGHTKIIEGTGLGLNIVKKIVELHQGKVWVESKIGKGTTFTALLPIITEGWHHGKKDTNG
ncbi:MAG: ATP-binding protein [Pseudomonadota bacterium]